MVITIGAEKGGVAKTRLATHIVALAAAEGVDVVLLDTDKTGSSMSWVRIRNEEGVEPKIPVFALPASPVNEIQQLAGKYDLVVVDIGAQSLNTMFACAHISDLVLVPCGADQQEIESTLKVFDMLKGLGVKHPRGVIPASVVLTRVSTAENSKATADLREMFQAEGIDVFAQHLAHREAWRATGKTGRALHELKGKDRSEKAVSEMDAVYKEILAKVSAATEA